MVFQLTNVNLTVLTNNLCIQEVQQIQSSRNKEIHRHIRVKMLKTKGRRTSWKHQAPIRLTSDFISETMEARREWGNIKSPERKIF